MPKLNKVLNLGLVLKSDEQSSQIQGHTENNNLGGNKGRDWKLERLLNA